jgi:hypothetical protein
VTDRTVPHQSARGYRREVMFGAGPALAAEPGLAFPCVRLGDCQRGSGLDRARRPLFAATGERSSNEPCLAGFDDRRITVFSGCIGTEWSQPAGGSLDRRRQAASGGVSPQSAGESLAHGARQPAGSRAIARTPPAVAGKRWDGDEPEGGWAARVAGATKE